MGGEYLAQRIMIVALALSVRSEKVVIGCTQQPSLLPGLFDAQAGVIRRELPISELA
jgi:hypothetical protein